MPLSFPSSDLRELEMENHHPDFYEESPGSWRNLGREPYVVIRPEEQNCNNWTIVSIDTFV
jgi:hypothetical protein